MATPIRKPAEAPEINLDPYTFVVDGADYTIPSFGAVPAGVIRANRGDETDLLFAAIEHLVTDEDTLAVIDAMVGPVFGEFVQGWQRAAGVQLPN